VSDYQRQGMILLAHIREQCHQSLGSYGRSRMTQELKVIGSSVGHRRVVGWSVSNRLKHDLALNALSNAVALRNQPPACIHHTDRRSQYCSMIIRSDFDS